MFDVYCVNVLCVCASVCVIGVYCIHCRATKDCQHEGQGGEVLTAPHLPTIHFQVGSQQLDAAAWLLAQFIFVQALCVNGCVLCVCACSQC